ncbi:hypothetical protein IQ276_029685 [Desmonostoc muscorum LEGE 12446]|uniref:Uncharacterized protein n=1 Tax=Desmonostoc muscorum LEGE 12446 TaxID=1828758 RepID=A0A8J7DID8_DESMC|nr:hypothetical protein [Desmonostoc muscorum]MCF2150523.1 hypothetical protein [Desmonostoc muscorum LEGE 12446]
MLNRCQRSLQIEPEMSGSPVLDQNSRLTTINGGLKYPIQGIIAFIFTDSTIPNPALFTAVFMYLDHMLISVLLSSFAPTLRDREARLREI